MSTNRQHKRDDLLDRGPVRLDVARIHERLQGRTILITGAGGSIGSELARRVAQFDPERLILLDRSESDLFRIDAELARTIPHVERLAVTGDIRDEGCIRDLLQTYAPSSLFHAAAYKHVPLMEANCVQAVNNNVLGTMALALAARDAGVEDFVLISTDKAVKPTSVMGVTKRIAELVIHGIDQGATRFVAVRFGNVLGSSGSVVQTFEEQIAARRPLTVTHPDAMRYFMTVTEAVQLVLQASTLAASREVFVLDMGEPVRVLDLARRMIRRAGLEPGRDLDIVFVGLRPGEKITEEWRLDQESLAPTSHDAIKVLRGGPVRWDRLRPQLDLLCRAADVRDVGAVLTALQQIVPEYTPGEAVRRSAAMAPRLPIRSSIGASVRHMPREAA